MKLTVNKDSISVNREHARELERQARALRDRNREIAEQARREEESILQTLVDIVESAGVFMTAREISTAMEGVMSVHEVAGQLTYARNSTDSGRKPQPYFGPRHYSMEHRAMQKAAPAVEVEERRVTRQFAEVDESGKVIPGGRQFKQTEVRNIYAIKR